jgi:hypothetical protein
MSSARFKSKHCIGLIKNRFPCLRGLNVRIKKPRNVKKVVQIFTARCAGDEDRREQVKHTLIELFNAAPL